MKPFAFSKPVFLGLTLFLVAAAQAGDLMWFTGGYYDFFGNKDVNFAGTPYGGWKVAPDGSKYIEFSLSDRDQPLCYTIWTNKGYTSSTSMDTEIWVYPVAGDFTPIRLDDDGYGGWYSKAKVWMLGQYKLFRIKAYSTQNNGGEFWWGYSWYNSPTPGQCEDTNLSFYQVGWNYPERITRRH